MQMTGTGLRIKTETKEKLDRIAEKKRRKPSELMRMILENYVEQFEDMQK
ncbi:hypothetical protein [Dipodfec virus UOA04_Rod_907]|nr:hypothetical protein [Dipodfec virus UOA04_Rod_907]